MRTLQQQRRVGNYIMTKNLGQGTFGKVKLGIHSLTGEKVAIKILQKERIVDISDVQRVSREITILKQIRHPHLVQLYQIIQTPKQLFLVMQYISQGQLFQHIVKRKKLKEHQACKYFLQLLAGVQYLHELGIVHRDLKPQNLLIDFDDTLKIVDFGLSNLYKTELKTACGSPCYAAPQMIAGKKYVGLKADLWSCGVILFAMLCGYLPFEDTNTSVLYKKIIGGQYHPPKHLSAHAKELLALLLQTNPDKRAGVREVRECGWVKMHSKDSVDYILHLNVQKHLVPVDQDVLNMLEEYDLEVKSIKNQIRNNRHTHGITVYYLLMKKDLRNGIKRELDINCRKIKNYSLKNINNSNTHNSSTIHEEQRNKIHIPPTATPSTTTTNFYDAEVDLGRMTTAVRPMRITSRLTHRQRKEQFSQQLPSEAPKSTRTYKKQNPYESMWKKRVSHQQKQRYTSLQVPEVTDRSDKKKPLFKVNPVSVMNKTFMGGIPKAYLPRWEDESERIRSILNTTISGSGKRKFHFRK